MGCCYNLANRETEKNIEEKLTMNQESVINPELNEQNNKKDNIDIFRPKNIYKVRENYININKENQDNKFVIGKKEENEMKTKIAKENPLNENHEIINNRDDKIIKNNDQIIYQGKEENKNLEEEKSISLKQKEKGKENDQLKFNKEQCKSIASSLPKRTSTNYQSLKDILKAKTENLSDKEKSYIIFLWICDNISYDVDSYFAGRDVDCTPEGVYRNGSTVCSGYSRLYKDIALYLGLEVECVNCYAKGVSYSVGQKMAKTNHEYNVIKLNNKWYPIDSTWGAGHVEGNKFIKSYNEFYFLANPELLIKTHFPADDKWQLTQKKYTLDEFLKWPQIKSNFYSFGFEKCFPEEGLIELKNRNNQKFIVYGNDMNQKGAMCNIYLLEGNCYHQQLNADLVTFYKDRFEVNTIFNKKGKYKVKIFGNNDRGNHYNDMLEYAVNVEKDAIKKLAFPTFYAGKENINVIEPLYDNLRSGEMVKFKIEYNLGNIIVIDSEWHYLKKNSEGYFELEIKIKTKKGKKVIIGNKTSSGSCNYLVSYNVV